MNISQAGIALIKQFEGFSATPYLCPAGYWTVGYGHVLSNQNFFSPSSQQKLKFSSITEDEAAALLLQDIVHAEMAVRRLITVPLTQNQFDALVSFTYNLGEGALQRSTLRQKILRGEYCAAAREFSKWIYAGGRRLPGLIKRRTAETMLYNA